MQPFGEHSLRRADARRRSDTSSIKRKPLLLVKKIAQRKKESVKMTSSSCSFFDKFHPSKPNTIFIKVHLSADSLPRKQLSVENSASFSVWFLCPSGGGGSQVRLAVPLKRKGGGDLGVLAKCFVRLLLTAAASSCHLHSTDTPEF